jgi:hypothetical protein
MENGLSAHWACPCRKPETADITRPDRLIVGLMGDWSGPLKANPGLPSYYARDGNWMGKLEVFLF